MSKAYSGIPLDQKRTWVVPRWLKEAFVAFAISAVLAVGISKLLQHAGSGLARAQSAVEADDVGGRLAPAIALPARGGGSFELGQLRGKLVLVNFWATWCPPCLEELPSLEKLAQTYDPASFEVLAVSVDEGWAPVEKLLAPKVPYRVVLDQGAKISQAYGTTKFPESYLVDGEGKVRLKFVGPRNWTDANMATVLESYGARRKG
jgi:thiol-disulfide isomerase/thioredoxin